MTVSEEIEVVGVPAVVAGAIQQVYRDTGKGNGLAPALVDAARSKTSPLHAYFTWDDSQAAEERRRDQAEQLIRRVRVKVLVQEDLPPIPVRAYVSDRDIGSSRAAAGSYHAIEDIAGHTSYQTTLLASIQRDIERLRVKYAHVEGFVGIAQQLLIE